ncbi:MAG: cysteine--tRNA ligase [Thermoplasmata archaeon]|nr:cysteine--tRNA ligase [Thermoplasmata archaeon]
MLVYNTLTHKKEEFVPLKGNRVTMFVCGVTPYDYSHLGHAKTYVAFDAIARYLRHKGYNVLYVQNVTDVDDHIINRSAETGVSEPELAEKYFKYFREDMEALGVESINVFAKATEFMAEIIEQIKGLIEKGYAYDVDGNVYYEVRKFKGFGKLSRQKLDELRPGARVEIDESKRNPEDFALWKKQKPGEPAWESPWGMGRPGWHIEDTAIAMAHFGEQYDIHGGATELVFPHHESEIAQAEALTGVEPYVKYWLHTGILNVEGEKMAKSLGNFWTIRDAMTEYRPEVLRFFLLHAHYRSPIDFSKDQLEEAKRSYQRLVDSLETAKQFLPRAEGGETESGKKLVEAAEKAEKQFEEVMDDDFNTREAISLLFELARELNVAVDKNADKDSVERGLGTFTKLAGVLGLFPERAAQTEVADKVLALIVEIRERARSKKDYETADWIRSELEKLGIRLEDTGKGVVKKAR